jgi:hypothetical protein
MHTYTLASLPLRFVLPALFLAATLFACDDAVVDTDNGSDDNGGGDIAVPVAYSFESRFAEDASSVAYPGQTVRYLLIQDLKILTDGLAAEGAEPVTKEDLLEYYDYEDSYNKTTLTGTGSLPAKTERYSEIATDKDLVGAVTSEYADVPLIGREETADELIRAYLDTIATRSQDPEKLGTPAAYTTAEGLDLSQLVNKLLLGAVAYSQGTGKYLNIALEADNSDPRSDGSPFTEMEHLWDEAFGYFGAARDYSNFADEELANGPIYKDANEDGEIDFTSEYNFTYATYAGKRDHGGSGVDFTSDIFQAFLEGRTAIVNEASAAEISAARDEAGQAWEQLVAANVVHYANSTLSDLDEVTESQIEEKNNESLNEHWTEMKGFAWALQYNQLDVRQISDTQLEELHGLIGDAPVYAAPDSDEAAAFRTDLNEAKDLLQSVFGFSNENLNNW